MQQEGRGRLWIWVSLALLGLIVASFALRPGPRKQVGSSTRNVDLSVLIQRVRSRPQTISHVVFDPTPQPVRASLRPAGELDAHYPSDQAQIRLQSLLERQRIDFASSAPQTGGGSGWLGIALAWLLPIVVIALIWLFLARRAAAGGGQLGQIMGFARNRARRIAPSVPKTTYADVAGADEAIEELREIRDFLAAPWRFRALGARIPKGVLLQGPPGTGKTLLARATAGEAGVPFFSISGSDFVEMFVGVGASRVRSLFEDAKREAPSIVFIDELDAVGRHRGAGLGGGHDEREQTLNQLLVEMDGFDPNENVVIMAATNRVDVLDPALLRPGRFDRQILVDLPDRAGRRKILEVHARGKPIDDQVDLDALAASTAGFTGADLANLLNEAALLAGRRNAPLVAQRELDEALLRVVAGPEKRTRIISARERSIGAYHECGHALVGWYLRNADKPQRVSIIGRGRALGFTLSLPEEDRLLTTRSELMDRLAAMLGGRAAEELVFGEVSTGAVNDLERVTDSATQMVTRYGMSGALGPRVVAPTTQAEPFLGRQIVQSPEHSEELVSKIDREVRDVIEQAYAVAKDVLAGHREELRRTAEALMEQETLERPDLERLLGPASESEEPAWADTAPGRDGEASLRPREERPGMAPA